VSSYVEDIVGYRGRVDSPKSLFQESESQVQEKRRIKSETHADDHLSANVLNLKIFVSDKFWTTVDHVHIVMIDLSGSCLVF